jgi:glycosyltransferase involved in cell wall biosynthesis
MYSQVPTIIYSHPVTGIARYAREEGWGMVVDQRSPKLLADSIRELSNNKDLRLRITNAAASTAEKYHRLSQIQESFLNMTRQLLTQNRSSNHLQFSNE